MSSNTSSSSGSDLKDDKNKSATDKSATDTPSTNNITLTDIFSSSNIMLVLWVLAAYFVTYSVFGLVNTQSTGQEYMIKIVDILITISIFSYLISYFYYYPKSGKTIKKNIYDTLNDLNTLTYTGMFLIAYSLVVFVFNVPISGDNAPISFWMLSMFATAVFTITGIVLFCKYMLGISILDTDALQSLWGQSTDKSDNTTKSAKTVSNEVFNVSNNLYTYDDARAVCSAFGARLATYDEIEEAYKKGGEWCNYGWSEGQMAFFPTQKNTWNELQKTANAKNNCGRPGVNGGYIENPYIKFGVNCFGKKPKPNDKDLQDMKAHILLPKTAEDELIDKKVQFWKDNADKLLNLNSFNRNAWSEY